MNPELRYLSNIVFETFLHPLQALDFDKSGDVVKRSERLDVRSELKSIYSSVKEKFANFMDRCPPEIISVTLGSLMCEGLAHLKPQYYAEFYRVFPSGGSFTLYAVTIATATSLTSRGLHRLYKNRKNRS